MISGDWTIEFVEGAHSLPGLRDEWRGLCARVAHLKSRHEWEAMTAFAHVNASQYSRIRFALCRDGRNLRAIVPLVDRLDRSLGIPVRVTGLPWDDEWTHGDVIAVDDESARMSIALALDALRSRRGSGAMMVLGPLASSSGVWDGVRDAGGAHVTYSQSAWNRIECEGSFSQHMSSLRKNFRANLRKAENKLLKSGAVRWSVHTGCDEVKAALEEFIALEASGWKGAAGTAIASRPRALAFYRSWLPEMCEAGRVEINGMYVDDRLTAAQLCIRVRDRYEMHKIAYDETQSRLAPGQLLFARTLERCFDDPGLVSVELMSDTPWHHDWGVTSQPVCMGRASLGLVGSAVMPVVRFRFGPMRRAVRALHSRTRRS